MDLPAAGGLDLGCDVAVQKNGKVHVIFDTLTCPANCTNERLFYTKSTNGGATWTAPLQVRDYNLTGFSGTNCPDAQDDRCIGPLGAIDVDRSGGPCNDNLFITYADYDAGGTIEDTDVWVVRSTNNGATWLAPVRVNDAGTGLSGVVQFNPTLAVDQYDGEVVVAWQDARNDANNKNVETFLATSTTCGASFGGNIQVANGGGAAAEFNNNATSYSNENAIDNPNGNPNQYGEYLGLDVQGSTAFLAWTDTRHFYPASTTEPQKENLAFELNTLVKPERVLTSYSVGADDGRVTEATEVGLLAIHTNGRTQVRLHFGQGDNDDGSEDYMGFYPGDAIDPANRPQLIVTYR